MLSQVVLLFIYEPSLHDTSLTPTPNLLVAQNQILIILAALREAWDEWATHNQGLALERSRNVTAVTAPYLTRLGSERKTFRVNSDVINHYVKLPVPNL